MREKRRFDTEVQYVKYKVLKEVARRKWDDTLLETIFDIPKIIVSGNTPSARCCVYKERAIVEERIRMAMGGDKSNPNVIEVIGIACDECPAGGYEVGSACRGCLAHNCEYVCKFGALTFDENHVAHIDKSKCVECGQCSRVCPYGAITHRTRPCEKACKIKAIYAGGETKEAKIDNTTCIACGNCVYHCPWGAISDKSYICDVIDMLKSAKREGYNVYAVVAPSILTQFAYAKPGQVIAGIKALGFTDVIEAALGADMVADEESRELVEKGSLISSCCPAFVSHVEKQFPELLPLVSSTLSPMASICRFFKLREPSAKFVFIGPCTAKKLEFQKEGVREFVDSVITFEELQALFGSRDIDITVFNEEQTVGASHFGRNFARCGGLADAVREGICEHGENEFFELKSVSCNGIEQCVSALIKMKYGKLDVNFIEGMACVGGCVGGAGCPVHTTDKPQSATGNDDEITSILESIKRF